LGFFSFSFCCWAFFLCLFVSFFFGYRQNFHVRNIY
jgi:hypothetical protein